MPSEKLGQMAHIKLYHLLFPNSRLCHKVKAGFMQFILPTTIETSCMCDRTSLEMKCKGPLLKWRFSTSMTVLSHLLIFGPFQR